MNLAQLLAKHGIIDLCAVEDPEGYDNGKTLERIAELKNELDLDRAELQEQLRVKMLQEGAAREMLNQCAELREKAEKACAEMRELLKNSYAWDMQFYPHTAVQHALSTSCGTDYVHKSELEKANKVCAEMRHALALVTICPTCEGSKVFAPECYACLSGEPEKCTCGTMEAEKCPECEGTGRLFSGVVEDALSTTCGTEYVHKSELEKAQDEADEQWLDAIAANWKALTGNPWETKDGECREEGLQANISAIFQYFEEHYVHKSGAIRCFKCDDGNTPLYCLNCGREGYVKLCKVQPLIEALEKVNGFGRADIGHQQMCDYVNEVCEQALAQWKGEK